ncbi:MAG: membrane protein insertion efficiency factor YidD [Gammaproteobacteria bacterium]
MTFQKKIFQFIVYAYQGSLGLVMGGHCRFYPSCSEYALEVLKDETQPLAGALRLIAVRLFSCVPWGKAGHHPFLSNSCQIKAIELNRIKQ